LIFVFREEKDYYRVVSVEQFALTAARTAEAATVCKVQTPVSTLTLTRSTVSLFRHFVFFKTLGAFKKHTQR
jgi:hypothetical protein